MKRAVAFAFAIVLPVLDVFRRRAMPLAAVKLLRYDLRMVVSP